MPQHELPEDLHSKRVATDADYWISWLERLAEIRRENEREVRVGTGADRMAP
jgi:hypothetical protein